LSVELGVRRLGRNPVFLFPFGEKGIVMKNVLNGVKSACGKVWDFTVGVLTPAVKAGKSIVASPMAWFVLVSVAVFMFLGAGDLLAQGTNNVQYEAIVEFGTIFDTIRTALAPIIVGAIGLGLAIWGARYIFSVIKSMAR
jgi:hypothetical protein